jgi:hypothetical protein
MALNVNFSRGLKIVVHYSIMDMVHQRHSKCAVLSNNS